MRQIYKHDKTQKRQYTIRHYTQVWHNIKKTKYILDRIQKDKTQNDRLQI